MGAEFDFMLAMAGAVLRAALGTMLLMAGGGKLRAAEEWQSALAGYRLVPDRLFGLVAASLPLAEMLAGLALLAGLVVHGGPIGAAGPVAAAFLFLLYGAAMGANLMRGRTDVDCGCDPGGEPRPIGWALVGRNVLLAGGCAIALASPILSDPLGLALAGVAGLAMLVGGRTIVILLRSAPPVRPAGEASTR